MNAIARSVNGSITSHQRLYLRSLMIDAELSTVRFSYMHRKPFADAGLPEPPMDADVDAHLCTLDKEQGSRLIKALKSFAGHDDDEEGDD